MARIITTTQWKVHYDDNDFVPTLIEKLIEILGDGAEVVPDQMDWIDEDTKQVIRVWPTLESAQQWAEFISGLGHSITITQED